MYPIWHLSLLKPTQRVRLLHHLTCTSSLTFSADTEWNTQHNCDTMIAHDLVITTGLLDNPFATRTDALRFFVHAIFAIPTTHHRGSTYTCCDPFLLVSFPLTSSSLWPLLLLRFFYRHYLQSSHEKQASYLIAACLFYMVSRASRATLSVKKAPSLLSPKRSPIVITNFVAKRTL